MNEFLITVGYDSPHPDAYAVCVHSLKRLASRPVAVTGIHLGTMQRKGLYRREIERRTVDGRDYLFDPISEAPMSTEFAISRFLAPVIAGWKGWAVFMDCDILALGDIWELFAQLDYRYALMCVQHDHRPVSGTKMDGRAQLGEIDDRAAGRYTRKNWSSVMAFNCGHQANSRLTLELINSVPGRDLHRFCWLKDHEIGALPGEWNFLVGHSDPQISPKLVHYTDGGPWLKGFDTTPFAAEWLRERDLWLRGDL
jgi:hypothetical protein